MSLTLLDGILLAVMLISAFLAMMRGFVREVFAIGTWIGAAAAALYFHKLLLPYIEPYVGNDLISVALAAAAVFFITLIILSFITIRISDFVLDSGIGPIDRTLGFLFGGVRGLLIVVVALMIFQGLVTRDNRPGWVMSAQSLPTLNEIGNRITAALPENVQATITSFLGSSQDEAPTQLPDGEAVEDVPEAQPAEIPQDDRRNVDRIINSTPETAEQPASASTAPTASEPVAKEAEELPALPQLDEPATDGADTSTTGETGNGN